MPRSVLPPGPRVPAAWQLLRYSFSPLTYLEQCAARYGEAFTVRQPGYGSQVILWSPQAVRDVFKGDPQVLHSGEANEFLRAAVGPTSVLVVDDQPHARQRRLLLPPFKGDRMRAFFDAMQTAAEQELRAWPTNTPIPMLDRMRRITLRAIAQAVMGLSPGAQLDHFEECVRRMLVFTRTRHTFIWVKLVPFRLLSRATWLPYFREARALDVAIVDHIAAMRRRAPDRRGASVLADLLNATDEAGAPLGDPEIRDALITMLIAGHDTTALGLAWALEQIASHPDVTEKLQAELQCATGGAPPRADQLDALPYLDATIRESLRIRTIFSFVARLTKQPFVAGNREYPAGVMLDIVLSLDRPLIATGLKVARVSCDDLPCLLLQRVAKPVPKHKGLDLAYLYLWLNSPAFTDSIDPGRSNGVPHISTRQVQRLPFALPPLPEQRRIVAKVDQLMALVDRLEAELAEARAAGERVMEAVVAELTQLHWPADGRG